MSCKNCNTCDRSEKKGCGTSTVFDWLQNIEKTKNTTNIIEVQFKQDRKGYYKNETKEILKEGDWVFVLGDSFAKDVGKVSLTGELVLLQLNKKNINKKTLKKVFRLAKPQEVEKWEDSVKEEEESTRHVGHLWP